MNGCASGPGEKKKTPRGGMTISVRLPVLMPLAPKKSIRTTCVPAEVLPIANSVDHPPPATTCAKIREAPPPTVAVTGGPKTPDALDGTNRGLLAMGGTGVGLERLVRGMGANSSPRKFNASIATGISEETVSNNGVGNLAA